MAQVSSIAEEQAPNPLSASKTILLRISRFNPESDDSSKFMDIFHLNLYFGNVL